MIIWLASYPRSGNSLLRTFLFESLGIRSTDIYLRDDLELRRETLANNPVFPAIGGFDHGLNWDDFYREATGSSDVYLVKTHHPPPDDQPAIHVVRDGRKACLSYLEFHLRSHPEARRTLAEIILGVDFFGDWTSHFLAWQAPGDQPDRPRRRRLVRYEELVNGSEALGASLADFMGHHGAIRPWSNPFAELQSLNPRLFREGRIDWKGDPRWTESIDALFAAVHGRQMEALGYWTPANTEAALAGVPDEIREICAAAARDRLPPYSALPR